MKSKEVDIFSCNLVNNLFHLSSLNSFPQAGKLWAFFLVFNNSPKLWINDDLSFGQNTLFWLLVGYVWFPLRSANLDNALDSKEMEEEVDKVLTAIAGETVPQLPEAVRKEKMKQPAQAAPQEVAIAEEVDNEEELKEIRARLAKVMS
ncbi:uncharacterized protein LOC111301870 [Durio zibethinus]|uniref:Uncharacterized protein LOC111301870 n=1 Tax=Durio zibethinus TaxID=66656 RepID=A0A6P5ZM41_DURZI|nr:uncharacterized protein LOC111301870 [Durio zibethinus]